MTGQAAHRPGLVAAGSKAGLQLLNCLVFLRQPIEEQYIRPLYQGRSAAPRLPCFRPATQRKVAHKTAVERVFALRSLL